MDGGVAKQIDVQAAINREFEKIAESVSGLNMTSESSEEDDPSFDMPLSSSPEPASNCDIVDENGTENLISESPQEGTVDESDNVTDEPTTYSNKLYCDDVISDVDSVTSESTSTVDSMSTVEVGNKWRYQQ